MTGAIMYSSLVGLRADTRDISSPVPSKDLLRFAYSNLAHGPSQCCPYGLPDASDTVGRPRAHAGIHYSLRYGFGLQVVAPMGS